MRFRHIAMLLVFSMALGGCGTMGVYESDFSCPQTYNGRCISLQGAYDLALEGKDTPSKTLSQTEGGERSLVPQPDPEEVAHTSYKESLYKRFDGLLKEPATPMVAPPQVMRVLLLPYKGESNELYMLRYVYFFVDEPKWVLGDSLISIEED